jgi:hypothetical protein
LEVWDLTIIREARGKSNAASKAITAMAASNSISVKARTAELSDFRLGDARIALLKNLPCKKTTVSGNKKTALSPVSFFTGVLICILL